MDTVLATTLVAVPADTRALQTEETPTSSAALPLLRPASELLGYYLERAEDTNLPYPDAVEIFGDEQLEQLREVCSRTISPTREVTLHQWDEITPYFWTQHSALVAADGMRSVKEQM
jgi:hypothetical protein